MLEISILLSKLIEPWTYTTIPNECCESERRIGVSLRRNHCT